MTDLDALDTLHKAATAGDWRTGIGGYGVVDAGTGVLAEFARKGDAAAIVALHNAWPAIRADIARLTKERDEARHQVDVLLARIYNDRGDYAYHNGIESAIDHAKLKIASVYGELEDANASVRRLTEERDEARAEVERLRELGPPHRMDAPDGPEADRLRKLFDDAGQGEHNVLALIDHYQRNSMEADERIRAVRKLLEENGCDCPCDHHPDERGDDCEVCLACRIGEAVGK